MLTEAEEIRGPAVLLLGPEYEVLDPAGLRARNLTVIQLRVTGDLGPCSRPNCDGRILEISVPVTPFPPGSGPTSLHTRRMCSHEGCWSIMARSDGTARREFIAGQCRYLKRMGMPREQIRRLHLLRAG